MNPNNFFIPNLQIAPYAMPRNILFPRNIGLFGRLTNGIRSFNWSSLLSGANKTINVMNQTIPLIKEAKPMMNNMKSMIRLAKAFGNETIYKENSKINNTNIIKDKIKSTPLPKENNTNGLTFFI